MEKGANSNATLNDGDSALNLAVKNGKNQFKTYNRLCWIQNEDIVDANLIDVIHIQYTDHVNISKWLLESGADVNHKGDQGRTPLITVAGQGKSNTFFIKTALIVFIWVSSTFQMSIWLPRV